MDEEILGLESIYGENFMLEDARGGGGGGVAGGREGDGADPSKEEGGGDREGLVVAEKFRADPEAKWFSISGIHGATLKFCIVPDRLKSTWPRCYLVGIVGCRRVRHRRLIEAEVKEGREVECFAIVERARRILSQCILDDAASWHEEVEVVVEEDDKQHAGRLREGHQLNDTVVASGGILAPCEHNCAPQVTCLASLAPDIAIKIISLLELDTVQRIALVSPHLARCVRENDLWITLWSKRWPGERGEGVCRSSFHSRYASEVTLGSLDEARTVVRVSRLAAQDPAPVSAMAWIGQDASHAAISAGHIIYVCSHKSLLCGNACGGVDGEEEEQEALRWEDDPYMRRPRAQGIRESHNSKVTCLVSSECGSTLAAGELGRNLPFAIPPHPAQPAAFATHASSLEIARQRKKQSHAPRH